MQGTKAFKLRHINTHDKIASMFHRLNNFIKLSGITIAMLGTMYISLLTLIGKDVYLDNKIKSDAVLVLGARSFIYGRYNLCLVARVDHGVGLIKKGYADKLIMSGGNDKEDSVNEAIEMKKLAIKMGLDENKIIMEPNATSTFENISYTKNILEENRLESVIIVTEPYHIPRADLIAKKQNLNHTVSPTTTSVCWNRWKYFSRYFLREPFAIVVYKLQGKI